MGKFLVSRRIRALRRSDGSGYNRIGNQFHPTVWPGKVTGDPASFRRFERRSAPRDGPLGGIQHSGMTVS
jgi:hypothetical protein